jgi:predicted nucleotidyltransferase
MYRKKSEGFFKGTLFVIFAVENEDETWFKWGEEKYRKLGIAKFEGLVKDNKSSVVRPGCYTISNSKFISGDDSCKDLLIDKIAFYSRDYCMLAYEGETVEVSGVVEEVTPIKGGKYYRVVVGYFDAYLSERKNDEYIRVIGD